MDFQKSAILSPVAIGIVFFGVYTARWLFDIPIPSPIVDGLVIGIIGAALLIGFFNARTGGRFWVTLAQPLSIVVAFIGAEAIRDVGNYQQRLAPTRFQTYVLALLLAFVLGTIAYGLGTQFRSHSPVGS